MQNHRTRHVLWCNTWVLLISSLLWNPALVSAATFTCPAGDVGCLTAKIGIANTNGHQHNTIHLQAGTYQPDRVDNTSVEGANAFPVITKPLRIIGEGAEQTFLVREDTAPLMRFFQVADTGTLRLEGLTLQGAEVDRRFFQRGGCLLSTGEPLVLIDVAVQECAAWVGGGIHQRGTLLSRGLILQRNLSDLAGALVVLGPVSQPVVLRDCVISENVAQSEAGLAVDPTAGHILLDGCTIHDNIGFLNEGGGIGGLGTLTIRNSVCLGNFGGVRGGCGSFIDGTVKIDHVVCVDNTAEHFGGCFDVQDADVEIKDSTIIGNEAGQRVGGVGGGIYHDGEGRVTLTRTRLLGNQAPEGPDCSGTIEKGRGTFIGDTSGCTVVEAPRKADER